MNTLWSIVLLIAFAGIGNNTVDISVESIIQNEISDVDEGALQGIAIFKAASGLQYTTNAGVSWKVMPVGSDGKALLLAPKNLIRVPKTVQAGGRSPWIEFLAWDRTQGSIGQNFVLGELGGETAFSNTYLPVVFLLKNAAVDEDMKLPIRVTAFTNTNNVAVLTETKYTVQPPEMGTWMDRVATDPQNIAGYFIPSGQLGVCTLIVEGKNKKGQPVTPGTLTIEVVPGAAKIIVVEALEQVER